MKKILTLLAIGIAGLTSCKEELVQVYSISIDPTELSFNSGGGDETVTVTSTADWELSGGSDWCYASSYYGKGDAEIIFTADPNEDSESGRSATFTFVSGDKKATLTITQEKKEYSISIEPKELTFGAEGGKQTVTVTSSENWHLDGESDWCRFSRKGGQSGDEVFFSVWSFNFDDTDRVCSFMFTCGNTEVELKVTQKFDDSPIIQFSNPDFEKAVIIQADINVDNQVSEAEAAYMKELNLSSKELTDLSDIKYFRNLTSLSCSYNQLTSLDVSNNTALTSLDCIKNQLTELDLSKNTALIDLYCYNNQLTSLDLSNNTALNVLNCSYNQLTSLDVSNNTALISLSCSYNQLTSLDGSNNMTCWYLNCDRNQLTVLDLRKCFISYINNYLTCSDNLLERIVLSKQHGLDNDILSDIRREYGDIITYVD